MIIHRSSSKHDAVCLKPAYARQERTIQDWNHAVQLRRIAKKPIHPCDSISNSKWVSCSPSSNHHLLSSSQHMRSHRWYRDTLKAQKEEQMRRMETERKKQNLKIVERLQDIHMVK